MNLFGVRGTDASIIVTNQALNTVLLQVNGLTAISGKVTSDGAYNGQVDMQVQKDDGTWTLVTTMVNGINQKGTILGSTAKSADIRATGTGAEMFPFNVRFIVAVLAAAGSATIKIRYL